MNNSEIAELEINIYYMNLRIKELKQIKPSTMETINQISQLEKEVRKLELERYDLINGTHKVEESELNRKLINASSRLGRLKEKNVSKAELERAQSNVDMLMQLINELELQDADIIKKSLLAAKYPSNI